MKNIENREWTLEDLTANLIQKIFKKSFDRLNSKMGWVKREWAKNKTKQAKIWNWYDHRMQYSIIKH